MREAPILLPVFTTCMPLDFLSEGTFAFNKKTHKQLEVTVRINEGKFSIEGTKYPGDRLNIVIK